MEKEHGGYNDLFQGADMAEKIICFTVHNSKFQKDVNWWNSLYTWETLFWEKQDKSLSYFKYIVFTLSDKNSLKGLFKAKLYKHFLKFNGCFG